MARAVILVLIGLAVFTSSVHAETIQVRGRAIDELRRPLVDVEVRARLGDARAHATSGPDGSFELAFELQVVPKQGTIVGTLRRGDEELSGLGSIWKPGASSTAIDLVMKPVARATLRLTKDGVPAPKVRAQVLTGSRYSRMIIDDVESDAEGLIPVALPGGHYTLLITDERFCGYGRDFAVPTEDNQTYGGKFDPLHVSLHPPRKVVVTVIDGDSGAPVSGVKVYPLGGHNELFPFVPAPTTDEHGVAVLERMPASTTFGLRAGARNPGRSGKVSVEVGAREVELRLERTKSYTVRWPVAKGPHNPPNGASLRFRTDVNNDEKRGDLPATFEDQQVVLRDYPNQSGYGYAVHDDARAAFLTYELVGKKNYELVSNPTKFLPVVPFGFQVLSADGTPLEAQRVRLEGRYLLRDDGGRLTRGEYCDLRLDADGRVEGEGVFFEPLRLKLIQGDGLPSDFDLGAYDPQISVEKRPVFKAPPIRRVEAHVTLDGVPGVHAGLDVYYNGHVRPLAFDADNGIVRFSIVADKKDESPYFSISAPGYVGGHTQLDLAQPDPIVVRVELFTQLTISLVLDPKPEDWLSGEEIELHRYDAREQRWIYAGNAEFTDHGTMAEMELEEKGYDCWRAFVGERAGRHRFVHTPSGLVEAFEIDKSRPVWVVRFDITRLRAIRGKLSGAGDLDLSGARIVEDEGAPGLDWTNEDSTQRGEVKKDNLFSLSVPIGRKATYAIEHPLIRRATFSVSEKGAEAIEVAVQPRIILAIPLEFTEDNVLSKVRELQGFMRDLMFHEPLTMSLLKRWDERWYGCPKVRVRREKEKEITWELLPRAYRLKDKTLLVPFDEPGTYTLWLEPDDLAPVALSVVSVPKEGKTLEKITLQRGSWTRILVAADSRDPVDWVHATATFVGVDGDPPLVRAEVRQRVAYRKGPIDELVVAGLIAGIYDIELKIELDSGVKKTLQRRTKVDGHKDAKWLVDLRLKKPEKPKKN